MLIFIVILVLVVATYFFLRLAFRKPDGWVDFPNAQALRDAAEVAYDIGSKHAIEAGKDAQFAYQVGVRHAISTIIMQSWERRRHNNEYLDLDSMPFHKAAPQDGKPALLNYIVWKYFPDQAELPALHAYFVRFKKELFELAKGAPNPDSFLITFLYSQQVPWQKYVADLP